MFAAGGGALSGREASKLQKAADEQNKSSFGLAFMTDATDTERERGVTVDVGAAKLIDMEKFQLALLDAPGHKVTRNNVNWPKKIICEKCTSGIFRLLEYRHVHALSLHI